MTHSSLPSNRFMTTGAFTLTELMVTMAVFALVVTAMISLQLFGFKMNSLATNKQVTTLNSLRVLDQIENQIRGTPNPVLVGNFNASNNTFTAVANGQPAIGNAVQVSNGLTSVQTFYLNTNTHALWETQTTATGTRSTVLSSAITNSQPFQAEDYRGTNILKGSSSHYTIKTTLQYSNWLYSVPNNYSDVYRLEARATPRSQ